MLRPTKEGEPYVVLSFWESREAFEAWRTSPGFRDGHKGGRTLPEDTVLRNVVEIHEVFTGSKGAGEG